MNNVKSKGLRKYTKKAGKTSLRARKVTKSMPASSTDYMIKLVNRMINKNVENKVTGVVTASNSVLSIVCEEGVASSYNYFLFNPVNSGLLNLTQGVNVDQRVGNRITLKRFVIKGTIYWDPAYTVAQDANSPGWLQSQGYVDLYIGRPRDLNTVLDNDLPLFYQNGSTTITPTAQIEERTYSVNKDDYNVLYHKRFKIGANTVAGDNVNYGNNDYSLNKEFGIDLCRKHYKNKIIRYNDANVNPNEAYISSTYIWATFTCPNTNPQIGTVNGTAYSPVRMIVTAYAEYEDA